jgi:hypothetical protein
VETTAASQGINTSEDFDAYVVDSRDTKVPSTVKSYDGANTYNNFDTDNSVMYSYKADDAATARDNVVRYAGRVQGGDFKWTFENSVDDASSDVNQPLKDALVAYKGWNGNVVPVSSSSSTLASSSSSAPVENLSSSSLASSSSAPVEDLSSSSSSSVTPQSSDSETSVSIAESLRAPAMRYIAADRRLEIGVAGSFRVDVVRMDGTKVLSSASRVVDLSGLRAGVYVVRLLSAGSALQLKILKSAP